MYLRFITKRINDDSGEREGLFAALYKLEDQDLLAPHEKLIWDDLKNWFNNHLNVPDRFSRSSKPRAKEVAISWFKDTATDHIDRMYELLEILRAHDVIVEIVRTKHPGYIVYEDSFQISAEPFNDQ